MDQKVYESIMRDLVEFKGPAGPIKKLTRRGIPQEKAKEMVMEMYGDVKRHMRKKHIWKVVTSGGLLLLLLAAAIVGGRVFIVWVCLAGAAFVYSLFQVIFAVGVDL